MIEIRFHGLGGHGAVVAAKFLADAAAKSGYQAQAFASYGALRRGGKVESYVRISEEPIQPHCKMYEPDCVVLMDEGLLDDEQVMSGVKDRGKVLINSPKPGKAFPGMDLFDVYTVDAYRIASEKGLVLPGGMPVINTTILGALAGMLEVIRLEDLTEVIRVGTPKAEKNVECAVAGYEQIIAPFSDEAFVEPLQQTDDTIQTSTERYPVYDPSKMERCNKCQICYMFCPSLAIGFQPDPFELHIDQGLCARCGICIEECPRGALSWGRTGHD